MAVRTIKMGLSRPDVGDVLDYATALIEEYGWNQMKAQDDGTFGPESSDEVGYTLHAAIGEACTRLSRAVSGHASKDWTVYNQSGSAENLRQSATALVQKHLPEGQNDSAFNDNAANVGEVLAVLAAARADVPVMEVPV